MSRRSWMVLLVLVAVAGAGAGVARYIARGRGAPRAVFLIVIDTLRADRLSCYGYADNDTRRIDELSGRGVTFDDAMTVGSWTIPSMGAMMTSRYPTRLGLVETPVPSQAMRPRQLRDQVAYTLALDENTLAESFDGAGYHTAGFVNQPTLNNRDGFVQGFSEWFYPVSEDTVVRRDLAAPLVDLERTTQRRTTWETTHNSDAALVETFVSWMDTTSQGRMFVWLHLSTPHKPYTPADRFMKRAGQRRRRPQTESKSDLYDGEVRATDELVGRILDAIDGRVGRGRAVIVFTADHGEEFGEHGMDDHGHTLHRECVHVPLIVAAPGLEAGRRVPGAVRLVDVMPTMLGLCGIEVPASGAQGVDLGRALGGTPVDLPVYCEGMLYGSTERSLQRGDFRLMWDAQGDAYSLYRPSTDLMEHDDVSGRFPDDADRLRSELTAFHDALYRDFESRGQALSSADSASAEEERARVLKAMKSLGYVNR